MEKISSIQGNKRFNQIHLLLSENAQVINEPADIANELANKFASNSSSQNYSQAFQTYKNEQEREQLMVNTEACHMQEHLNLPISMKELVTTLDASKNSSPGPDNIPNILLKNLPQEGKDILLKIYNYIWIEKTFPKVWKAAIVIPIPKPGKDPTLSGNYRPISLTCNMCKILEKIVNRRLRWYLDYKNIISSNQFGFRPGHSTTSHLVSIDTYIQEAFANKQHVLAVNLDIEKAYDMVWMHRVLQKLSEIGVRDNMFQFIKHFTEDRVMQVRANGTLSMKKRIENGVPQGSILSVTLFLLAINDADEKSNHPLSLGNTPMILLCFVKEEILTQAKKLCKSH